MSSVLEKIATALMESPVAQGAFFSATMAALRVVYDEKETKLTRMALEVAISAGLAVIAGTAVIALGANQQWALAAGGAIGTIGVMQIRAFANYAFKRKIDNMTGGPSDE